MDNESLFQQINLEINKLLFHPMQKKYLGEITCDKDYLRFIINIIQDFNISSAEVKTLATSLILIETALNIHDHTAIASLSMHNFERNLAILIGDYYSGLYYAHISMLNNEQLIKELAVAIKDINSYKINHIYNNLSAKQKNNYKLKIQTKLLQKVCLVYNKQSQIANIKKYYERHIFSFLKTEEYMQ